MNIFNAWGSKGQSAASGLFSKASEMSAPAGSLAAGTAKSSFSEEPAISVSISPQVKSAMERVEAERKVAQLLEKQLAGATDKTSIDIFFSSEGATGAEREDDTRTGLDLKALGSGLDDPQAASMLNELRQQLLVGSVDRNAGPEAAQNFKNALANGTVTVQRASDVPGVNYKSTVTDMSGAGGTTGMRVDTSFDPSPEVREAIDTGKALVFWNRDFGDLYLTW